MRQSHPQWQLSVIRLLIAVLLLSAAGLYLRHRPRNTEDFEVNIIPPTCTESGYTLYTSVQTGATEVRDLVPALGHTLEEYEVLRAGTDVEPELRARTCSVCRTQIREAVYPPLDIARLSLNGNMDGIAKQGDVPLTAEFLQENRSFSAYVTAKYQGHSSLQYSKKNYTIKFYTDPAHDDKYRLTFSHWNPEHKYVLKAHYVDPSMCRNLVCADIWADMVRSRTVIPHRLSVLSNYGSVDGFPIALYINDSFHGLYTMNLHKDERLFGLEDGAMEAIMNINHAEGPAAFFREEAAFGEDTPWEIERCATEDSQWSEDRLNELIRFVQTSDDTAFRQDLHRYLDIDSAVDYVITMYALGLQEHCAKDLILVTYGKDDPWICSMYDMEEAFDLDGPICVPGTDSWDSGTGSLLWDRFLTHFHPEIRERYTQLRQTILDPENLCGRVDAFVGQIPPAIYEADAAVNGVAVHTPEHTRQLKDNIVQLISLSDSVFLQ